jgi:hypothetical protein
VKGKKQNLELNDPKAKALKTEITEIQNFAWAAGGIQVGSITKSEQSEVFTKWSQMTFEDDTLNETSGTFSILYNSSFYSCS